MESYDKRILTIGLACLDIVMICKSYPEEDSDQRCISHKWQRGGNASNNSTIMAEFGVHCEYFGSMSKDLGGQFLKRNFEAAGVCIENCVYHDNYDSPTSVVLINSLNGSRTIVHSNKNLPEISFEDFKALDMKKYKWIHFEARPSVEEIKKMIKHVTNWNKREIENQITISIELEKAKPQFVELLNFADFVFISKDFAKMCGHNTMKSAVVELSKKIKFGSALICPWGEEGACANTPERLIITASAYPPIQLVDTLGAGDTFVAATIMSISKGKTMQEALELGCKIAGTKCGMEGVSGLRTLFPGL